MKLPLQSVPCSAEPENDAFSVGTAMFGGRFRIERKLGLGAMGAVYAAFDAARGESVALKTLHHMNSSAIYAIKDEFRSLCDVVHPNIVSLHELFADAPHWFFTMDLVAGTDFMSFLSSRRQQRSVDGADDLHFLRLGFRQLVAGIDAIHAAGMLHLDLKPSNVLVTDDARVVVLDFGLCRATSTGARDELLGTPAYMAPEQAAGREVSEATDWYALGVVLFEALTGRLPFDGSAARIVADKILKVAPRASSIAERVPADLDELCQCLLAREPEDRPSARDIRATLEMPAVDGQRTSLAPRNVSKPPFVGRRQELSQLRDCYSEAALGQVVLAVVAAPSGMGKSALIAHFIASMPLAETPLVLSGRCFERESVPYNGVDSVIDELGIQLRRLSDVDVSALLQSDPSDLLRAFPVLRGIPAIVRHCLQTDETVDVKAAKRNAVRSLREILAGLSQRRTVLIFIDDLHWADSDTTRLLLDSGGTAAPGARSGGRWLPQR
ncbi:MAG: serine/threonine-protein kinase [Polyangiaceae bacterium]